MCTMTLWNEKELPLPPVNTYKAVKTNIDISHLQNVFREGTEFFSNEKFMYAEYVVLSRIVYRMKQKFRSAKDFKAMEKLNKALKNYFDMNISSNLNKFVTLIPTKYKEKMYLPTKNLLDYILVRLQGLAKLMERIVETSKIAAYLLDKRMHTGHFWKIAFITFSLVSRVYTLAKYTTKFVCDFYRKLLPFSSQLKNTGGEWLPQDYILPKDLQEWINIDWLEFDDEVQIIEVPTELPDIMKFFDLVDNDEDVQFCDEYFMIDDDEDDVVTKGSKKNNKGKTTNTFLEELGELRGFDNKEDIGEVIKIEDSFQEYNEMDETQMKEYNEKLENNNNIKQNVSTIDLVDDSVGNLNLDGSNGAESVTISSTTAAIENRLESDDKNVLEKHVSSKSDSYSNISVSESDDEDNKISDESIVSISDKVLSTTLTDSDEDVITILDTSLEQPAKLNKQKLKKLTKNAMTELQDCFEDTVVLVPDTPVPKQRKSYFNSMSQYDDDTVIILDTPRSLKTDIHLDQKNKIGNAIKQVNRLNNISKLNHSKASTHIDVSNSKKRKKKINKDPKKKNIQLLGNNSGQDIQGNNSSLEVVQQKVTKNKMKKSKNELKNIKLLKRNSKKCKLAIETLPESGNLVRESTYSSVNNNKIQKNGVSNNKISNTAEKGKPQQNLEDENTYNPSKSIHKVSKNNSISTDKNLRRQGFKKRKRQQLANNSKKLKLAIQTLPETSNFVSANSYIPLKNTQSQEKSLSANETSRKQRIKKIKQQNSINRNNDNKRDVHMNDTSRHSKSTIKSDASSSELQIAATKNDRKKKKLVSNNKSKNNSKKLKSPKKIKKPVVTTNGNMSHTENVHDVGEHFEKTEVLNLSVTKFKQTPENTPIKSRKKKNRTNNSFDVSKVNKSKNLNKSSSKLSSSNKNKKPEVTTNVNMSHTKNIHDVGEHFEKTDLINLSTTKLQQTPGNTPIKSRKKKNRKNNSFDASNKNKSSNVNNLNSKRSSNRVDDGHQSSSLKLDSSSMSLKKRKRYWEYSHEQSISNNSAGSGGPLKKQKKLSITLVTQDYIPLAFSTPKTNKIFSIRNKSTVNKTSSKKKKKSSNPLNNLAQQSNVSQKIKKKLEYSSNNIVKAQKSIRVKKERN